jgi:hypothetical protein
LNYKQQFRLTNNKLSFWGGRPYGKSDFLRIIGLIREKAFNPRIIRQSFKERGIYLVNSSQIVDNLANQQDPPELYTPELRSYIRILSPEFLSSSVENSPPTTVEALERNHAKILRDLQVNSAKAQRNIAKNFKH